MPEIDYLMPGVPVVYVKPDKLLTKLLANPVISDTIRTEAPYDKLRHYFHVWVMVTLLTLYSFI